MEFCGNYTNKPVLVEPEMSSKVITEQTGYMSTKELVEQMVLAGQRLYDYRHGLLDYEKYEGQEDDSEDFNQDASPVYEKDLVEEALEIEEKIEAVQEKRESLSSKKDVKQVDGDEEKKGVVLGEEAENNVSE